MIDMAIGEDLQSTANAPAGIGARERDIFQLSYFGLLSLDL